MDILDITPENIDREHICCALSDKKGENCVSSKKNWMKAAFRDGLVFKRMDARGKAFIEYIPAEKAWCPIDAKNCLHIDCFWVSGSLKGKGYSTRLLDACVADAVAAGKNGLTIVSSDRKMPFLSDPDHLRNRGFRAVDSAPPHFQLFYLPVKAKAPPPKFRDAVKAGDSGKGGFALYYSNQCPFTDKYAPIFRTLAKERGAPVKLIRLESAAQAQRAPTPFTAYSLFHDGRFVTNEILSEKKIDKLLAEKGF